MILANYHTHTIRCKHAVGTEREYIEAAISERFKILGFSDHTPEWLINEHYMLQTKEQYPVLHSTYEGLHYSETFTNNKLKELYDFLQKY